MDTCGALHDLEGAAGDPLQLVQVLVVPAAVAAAGEEPVAAVVGDDQAVALHRQSDRLRGTAEAAETVTGLQSQAQAHRRRARGGGVTGAGGGGVAPGVAGAREGDANRMFEAAGGDLVVADETGEDRQAGGVGRGPALRSARRRAQVPFGP